MKKFLLFIITFLVFCNVKAMEVTRGDHIFEKLNATIAANPNNTDNIRVYYRVEKGSNSIDKITVNLNLPTGMTVVSNDTQYSCEATVSGSGSSYTIDLSGIDKENLVYCDGFVDINVKLPSAAKTTEYKLTGTVKSFNSSNTTLETKQINYNYVSFVNTEDITCDSNKEYTLVTNPAINQENQTIMATSSTVDVSIVTSSSKTKVYYLGTLEGDEANEKLSNGNKKLNVDYGRKSHMFSVVTECGEYNQHNRELYDNLGGFDGESTSDFGYSSPSDAEYIEYIGFIVQRDDNRSKVNTLKTLTISNVTIDFKPELKLYNATVKNEISSVDITSTLTDSKAKYADNFGNRKVELAEGKNEILIKVISETGAENVYTINIERELSSNGLLKVLKVNEKNITLDDTKLKYEVIVPNDVTNATVVAEPQIEAAKVEIPEIKELVEGNNNIEIVVTAPNGDKKIYALNIKRDLKISSNSLLKSLKITGYDIKFDQNNKSYTIKIGEEKELKIEALAEHEKAKVLITGNKNLENGSVIKVKVTAEDESVSIYSIKIEKEEKKLNMSLIIPIIGIGVGVLVVVIVLVLAKGKKKKIKSSEEVVATEPTETVSTSSEEENSNDNINNM